MKTRVTHVRSRDSCTDLDAVNEEGMSPLSIAVTMGNKPFVEVLVEGQNFPRNFLCRFTEESQEDLSFFSELSNVRYFEKSINTYK
jgi:ankyrin repeat protein